MAGGRMDPARGGQTLALGQVFTLGLLWHDSEAFAPRSRPRATDLSVERSAPLAAVADFRPYQSVQGYLA